MHFSATRRIICIAFTTLLVLASAARANDDVWIGEYRLIVDQSAEPDLTRSAFGAATFELEFAREVGGVNFQSTLLWNNAPKLSFSYDKLLPDGRRVTVALDGKLHALPLFDWQAKPIVAYANSNHTAVVSLFGDGPRYQDYYYIRYHPALRDTLLGLRLLQADMYLMDPLGLRDSPRQSGRILKAAGERDANAERSLAAAKQIERLLESKPAGSWILNDVDTPFSIETNSRTQSVSIAGSPHYFFWNTELSDSIQQRRPSQSEQSKPPATDWEKMRSELEKRQHQERRDRRELILVPQEHYTDLLRSNYELLQEANPAVFDAAANLARYAALFRFARQQNSKQWEDFASLILSIEIEPVIRTPTRFSRNNGK
jgi:hypothetical protein